MDRGIDTRRETERPGDARKGARLFSLFGLFTLRCILCIFCLSALVAAGCSSAKRSSSTSPVPTTSPAPITSPATTAPAPTTATVPNPGSTTTPTSSPVATGLGPYLPLYPFNSPADVQQWQASYLAGGHQPWHLNAGDTALSFAGWLGYTNVDAVIKSVTDTTGAHVSVGFRPAKGSSVTSAIVHLVRWGSGANVPWEVVGTDDTTFSLTTPAYRTTVPSSLTVGGHITGVDENIKVQARDLKASGTVGSYCCLPSGGTNTPWSVPLSITAVSGHVLTIAAQTGGHVASVERFTVTGVFAG